MIKVDASDVLDDSATAHLETVEANLVLISRADAQATQPLRILLRIATAVPEQSVNLLSFIT